MQASTYELNYYLLVAPKGVVPAAVVEDEAEVDGDALDGGAEAGSGLGVDEPLDEGAARLQRG